MTGTTSIVVRLPENMLADLDRWRNDLANRLGRAPADRSEAIRAILEGHFEGARSRGLRQAEPPTNNISESAKMAGKAIDHVADQQATSGERAQRKRDLIEGPEEFKGQRQARKRKKSR
jgi:hypothetical protein